MSQRDLPLPAAQVSNVPDGSAPPTRATVSLSCVVTPMKLIRDNNHAELHTDRQARRLPVVRFVRGVRGAE